MAYALIQSSIHVGKSAPHRSAGVLQEWLDRQENTGLMLGRAAGAALLSGGAFYLVSGIWTKDSHDPNLPVHFASWAFAFLPGFLALFVRRTAFPAGVHPSRR